MVCRLGARLLVFPYLSSLGQSFSSRVFGYGYCFSILSISLLFTIFVSYFMRDLIHSYESSLQDANDGFSMMAVVCLVKIKNTEMW